MPHLDPDVAGTLTARYEEIACQRELRRPPSRTTLYVILDAAGQPWGYVFPSATVQERVAWLRSLGIDPGNLWDGPSYAYGIVREDGSVAPAGNDERLKDLLPEARRVYRETGEELFPLSY